MVVYIRVSVVRFANAIMNNHPAAIQAIEQRLEQKRSELANTQTVLRHAAEMERLLQREVSELETARKVLCGLASPDSLSNPQRNVELVDRARYMHERMASSRDLEVDSENESRLRAHRRVAIDICKQLLADGSWMTTEHLLAQLVKRGVHFAAQNPSQRLSQILSLDRQFKNQRGRGWALVPEELNDPFRVAQITAAQQDALDLQLRARARAVVASDPRSKD